MAMRIVGLVVLCGPRELDSVARYRTDFVWSVLQYAAAQCPQSFHRWLGTRERAMRASAKCLFE